MTGLDTHLLLIILILLVFLSGFFSGSETGMMSINRYRLRHMARKGNPAAARVARLLERPDRLLGVILIGNTFANIFASAVATVLAVHYFGDIGVIIATILLTFIILIFAETAPKTLAALHPEWVAFPASLPLKILLKLLYPLVFIVNAIANGLLWLFRVRVGSRMVEPLSLEELRTVVHEATGKMSSNYQEMLLRVLDLKGMTVEDVMVPRNEVYGIDLDQSWDNILQTITRSEHAHLPIYHENLDRVEGMLNLRKILSIMQHRELTKKDLIRYADKVYFVPEGALLNRQLLHFQDQQESIGLVVDEYGDIQGLVSLQDILEEIVGEFARGVEETSRYIKRLSDGSVVVDGRVNVRDLNRIMRWKLPTEGPKTLSGLVIEVLEMIPAQGISARIAGYPMEVIKVKRNMVKFVKVMPHLYRKPHQTLPKK